MAATSSQPRDHMGGGEAFGWPATGAGLVYAAVALSFCAALIHLWMTPEHFAEWWGYGAFFLACALAQGLLSVTLLRWPGAPISLAGIWGNVSILVLYVVTRTSGVPLGPHGGEAEAAGLLDMMATAAETGVVICLVALLGGTRRGRTINALLLVGVVLWALRLSGTLS